MLNENQVESNKTYYGVLGVATNATPAEISSAYKKLSLIYHPDRNANDDTASAKLFEVNEAYHTLNDPAKRSAYDASIPDIVAANAAAGAYGGSMTHSGGSVGGEGSLVGMISNLASVAMRVATTMPLFSQDLPEDITDTAKILCQLPSFTNPAPLSQDSTLRTTLQSHKLPETLTFMDLAPLGFNCEAKVERIQCNYYRLEVTPEMHQSGFLLQCCSESKDKFKLLVFNAQAELLYCENSHKSRDRSNTNIVMYCNAGFDTFELTEGASGLFTLPVSSGSGAGSGSGATTATATASTESVVAFDPTSSPAAAASSSPQKEQHVQSHQQSQGSQQQSQSQSPLPPLFSRIKSVETSRKLFPTPGFYLIGIVGENFVGRSSYHLVAAPTKNSSDEIAVMKEADTSLLTIQQNLVGLQSRYLATKAAYEATLAEIKATEQNLESIVQARDLSYRSFTVESLCECNPSSNVNVVMASQASLNAHAKMRAQALAKGTSGGEIDAGGSGAGGAPPATWSGNMELRTPRLRPRRDSLQEVQHAAAAVANKAGEVVTGAAASASETAHSYGGWMSQKIAAGTAKISRVRASFSSPSPPATAGGAAAPHSETAVTGSVITPVSDIAIANPEPEATTGDVDAKEAARAEKEQGDDADSSSAVKDEEEGDKV